MNTAKQPPDRAEKGGVTPKQESVALLLASGHSIVEAAAQADVGERTVKTWLADKPAFPARVSALRGELTAAASGRLVAAMTAAVDTLTALLTATSETVRCSAARCILETAVRVRDQVELEGRLAAIEAHIRKGKR